MINGNEAERANLESDKSGFVVAVVGSMNETDRQAGSPSGYNSSSSPDRDCRAPQTELWYSVGTGTRLELQGA